MMRRMSLCTRNDWEITAKIKDHQGKISEISLRINPAYDYIEVDYSIEETFSIRWEWKVEMEGITFVATENEEGKK